MKSMSRVSIRSTAQRLLCQFTAACFGKFFEGDFGDRASREDGYRFHSKLSLQRVSLFYSRFLFALVTVTVERKTATPFL